MRITTKGRYALRAVYTLAMTAKNKPVSIRELAEKEDISPEFLEQIFFRLKKTGMISSTRGPGGGFRLNKSPQKISLYDILEASGEGVQFTPCLSPEPNGSSCDKVNECVAHKIWEKASNHIKNYFDDISLQSIIDEYHRD